MNTKICFFVLALVLAAMACNAALPRPTPSQPPLISTTTETAPFTFTPTPSPSATPGLTKPRIKAVLYGLAYASESNWNKIDPTDPYPHTSIPADINVVEANFYLELSEGWPAQQTELRTQWYRDGIPIDGSGGSLVCTADKPCSNLFSKQFYSNGFGAGRIEVRIYLGNELLEGPQAEVWAISGEWVGDMRLMQCDDWIDDNCEKSDGQLAKFPDEITIPVGSDAVYVGNAYASLPSDTGWRVELYKAGQLIDSETQTVNGNGTSSGWRDTQLSNQDGTALKAGLYTVKLIWKGNEIETIQFEVNQSNGPNANRLSGAQQN